MSMKLETVAPVSQEVVRQQLTNLVVRQALKEEGSEELKTIYIFLTRKCNLGCQHCYIEGVGPRARDDDFGCDSVKKIVERALPHGLRRVKVSGGEPVIHREFFKIIEYLGGVGLDEIVLETNGTLLDDDGIECLRRIKKLHVFISLDHFSAAAHDEFRQHDGSYAKAVRTIRAMAAAGIRLTVTTTANQRNAPHILEIIKTTLDWGITRHRTLLNIHPIGNAKKHASNALSIAECCDLIEAVLGSEYFASGRAYVTLPPALLPLDQLEEVHSCGWGKSVLGVLSNGDVSMCSASYDDPDMIGGNIFKDDLMSVWKNSTFFNELREVASGKVKGICSNCVFYSVCRGVCRMSSYAHYGEKDAPYPFCQEMYNLGKFPPHAMVDPSLDCTYRPNTIMAERSSTSEMPLIRLSRKKEEAQT